MKKFCSVFCLAMMAIASTVVSCKDDTEIPAPVPPVPPESKTLSLENFKIIPAGFVCYNAVMRTDPSTGNSWTLVFKSVKEGNGMIPMMQYLDSQLEPITGEWKPLTEKECPSYGPAVDFAILADGSAICTYAQVEDRGLELVYYSIIKPDGTIINGNGTLVYDLRKDYPDLKECTAQGKALSDGKGGAWIAVSYRKMIVVRHISPSLEMSDPVKIFTKEAVPLRSAMNINMMLAEDGGLFLTEMDMTEDEVHTTAVWQGYGNLIKVDADCKSYTSTQITPDDTCNPASEVQIIPDTKGGAYLITIEITLSGHSHIIKSIHMDKNGNVGELKTVAQTDNYRNSAFAVVPSDNSLCIALGEQYKDGYVVSGYKISIIGVNEASDVLYEMPFRDFGDDANLQAVSVIARAGSVMDVCYVYFDPEGAPISANAGVGTVNVSNKTVVPYIDRMPLTDGEAELYVMPGSEKYMDGKVNIGWADILLSGNIHVGQIVLK